MNQLVFLESEVKMPLLKLPVRSTFVAIKGAGILISPGSCLEIDQLKKLDAVTDLVAPSLFHGSGIAKAATVFPSAKIWGVPGAREQKPEVAWTDQLTEKNWNFQTELPMVALRGMPKANEVIFFHKPSKSLIVTDLCFNMTELIGIGPWIVLSLFGTYQRFATSKFFVKFIKDKAAFESSLSELFAFDFENIIVSHGANIIGNGKDLLAKALEERNLRPK